MVDKKESTNPSQISQKKIIPESSSDIDDLKLVTSEANEKGKMQFTVNPKTKLDFQNKIKLCAQFYLKLQPLQFYSSEVWRYYEETLSLLDDLNLIFNNQLQTIDILARDTNQYQQDAYNQSNNIESKLNEFTTAYDRMEDKHDVLVSTLTTEKAQQHVQVQKQKAWEVEFKRIYIQQCFQTSKENYDILIIQSNAIKTIYANELSQVANQFKQICDFEKGAYQIVQFIEKVTQTGVFINDQGTILEFNKIADEFLSIGTVQFDNFRQCKVNVLSLLQKIQENMKYVEFSVSLSMIRTYKCAYLTNAKFVEAELLLAQKNFNEALEEFKNKAAREEVSQL